VEVKGKMHKKRDILRNEKRIQIANSPEDGQNP
jgi:hypothetical protein